MRILLASNASYAPPRGGSTRSNLAWLRHLASAGHAVRVVCAHFDDDEIELDGITICRVRDLALRSQVLAEKIKEFHPDWVLVSSEDVSQILLRVASEAVPGRLIYLAHTPQFFPFGPESWHPDGQATGIIRKARAVVAIGHHMASYIQHHLGRQAHVIHPPIYGRPPYTKLDGFNRRTVLMINPCVVKGISIFLALAERLPHYTFAALTGWGTGSHDREALARRPNVRLLESVGDIEEVLSQASLLLMPSLWYEGFGLIVMEAMLRGLPVVSSDSGGLKEAKQGTGFVIPVRPIERYEQVFDENHMPRAVAPEQDIEPWLDVVARLLTNHASYSQEAGQARAHAMRFVSALRVEAFEELLVSLQRSMRILLAHNSLYYPSHGGGDRSNRLLMEALSARGHTVRVVSRIEQFGPEGHDAFLGGLRARSVEPESVTDGTVLFDLNGVEVHTLTLNPQLRVYFATQIKEFGPDVIVTSTDDPAQLLFGVALQAPGVRVVHLVRATIAVPFGPDSSSPSAARTAMLRRADGLVGVSEYVARYVREWGHTDAIHLPISLMEPGEFPAVGRFENQYVLMVNPCAVKGISIFIELARRMPTVAFAAVPVWGTTAADVAALLAEPNITILPVSDRIEEILRQTRVLLVPSLWAEARSRIVVEAMAHGVPVIASDSGGIAEAKLGVDYLIPVRLITRYHGAVDGHMVPVPEVPPQDVAPWQTALERLTTDPVHYQQLSAESRRAAVDYIGHLSVQPFESYLQGLLEVPAKAPSASEETLSPERRKLLALRLRQRAKAATHPWFPLLEQTEKPRLFCFPHAGGGITAFSQWSRGLGDWVSVCPIRPPGRETRMGERPLDEMATLVDALAAEIEPNLDHPFLFFGHSMGAAVAFELARRLRHLGKPQPLGLFVSAARAPQFRLHHKPQPEPDEAEFLQQLKTFGGIPAEVLASPSVMQLVMPALRADARLYRNYVYTVEPPLAVPIRAYAGITDPQIPWHEVERWREQTKGAFAIRTFDGGHFFIQTSREEFLRALAEDIAAILHCK